MSAPLAIGQLWRRVRDRFRAGGIDTPELDARLLAQHVLGLDAGGLLRDEQAPAPAQAEARLEELMRRRLDGEPVARLVGHQEFYGLDFALNAATLVPRPETELLVDTALERRDVTAPWRLLDLGTGSGAIIVALLAQLPRATGIATDLSTEALGMAEANAARHGVSGRLELRRGSWFDAVAPGSVYDVILSNPPYIESAAIGGLMREVRIHDPLLALDGGPDGLAPYREIAARAGAFLNPGGLVAVEIGATQGQEVAGLFADGGFAEVSIRRDLAGLDRVVVAHQL